MVLVWLLMPKLDRANSLTAAVRAGLIHGNAHKYGQFNQHYPELGEA
jgi:hypothetical protein